MGASGVPVNAMTWVWLCGQVAAQSVPWLSKARLPTRMSLKCVNVCLTGSKMSMPLPEET